MKIYKIYFRKTDTPLHLDYQPNKKYHTIWTRSAYSTFLKHKVWKIKLFGIFTIYEDKGE